LRDFCAYRGVFGDGPSNAANRIFPRPTPVAMATKFGDKMGYNSAYVGDFCEIFAPVGGFSGMGHRMLPIRFSSTDSRCHGNEIWDKKLAITR